MEDPDKLNNLRKRVSVLEFILVLTVTSFMTFSYGVTQIFNIDWYLKPLLSQALQFFGISFFSLNFILFVINAVEKVKPTFHSLWDQWGQQGSLNKIIILLGLPSSIYGTIQFIQWVLSFIR